MVFLLFILQDLQIIFFFSACLSGHDLFWEAIAMLVTKRNMLTFAEAWDQVFEQTVSKDKLYDEVRAGRIPHVKVGTKIIFRRDTLESWFLEQEGVQK